MAKSGAASTFGLCGVPVFDADAVVHGLTAPGGAAVRRVAAAFPGSLDARGGIDRQSLGRLVFGDPAALPRPQGGLPPLGPAAPGRLPRRRGPPPPAPALART